MAASIAATLLEAMSIDSEPDDKLGQILLNEKLVTKKDISHALEQQKILEIQSKRKFKLGEILLFMEKISLQQLQGALLQQKNKAMKSRADTVKAKELSEKSKAEKEGLRESFMQFKGSKSDKEPERRSFIQFVKSKFGKN